MDGMAVIEATDDELKKLGLFQIGHIVALKAMCTRSKKLVDRKELANIVKQSSKDRIKTSKTRTNIKTVYIGWQHYDANKKRYVTMRETSGGGVRKCTLDINSTVEEVMTKMEGYFFPNSKNKLVGRLSLLQTFIGNSNGEILGSRSEGFKLSDYISKNSFARLRLYILSRKKRLTEYCFDSSTSDDSDFENVISKRSRFWDGELAGADDNNLKDHSRWQLNVFFFVNFNCKLLFNLILFLILMLLIIMIKG